MKYIPLLLILLLSLTVTAQLGIRAGVNTSYFTQGDKTFAGIDHNYQSIIAGLFDKIPLSACSGLQVELVYAQGGAKNPKEDNRTFKTYNIQLPVTYVLSIGDVNLQAGAYLSKLVGATNSDFFTPGPNFNWSVSKWKWYQRWDWGFVAGIGIDLHNVYLEGHLRQGMRNLRQYDFDNDGVYDPKMQGCRNASADVSLYIPLNTFK